MSSLFDIPDPDQFTFRFRCVRARQPVGDIFIAAIPWHELVKITHFDVRRVLQEERDFERYLGIQRPLDSKRVLQLQQYVNFIDASFPTSIIIAIEQDYVSYSEDGWLIVSNFREGEVAPSIALRRLARVLDGQHRIAGLEGFRGQDFDLSVTIFVGADIADQAQIFATVNLEQNKVNRSLAYDLFELSRSRSPQKTCHNVVVALDRDVDGPFYRRIKRLGVATQAGIFQPITQATVVDGLMQHISLDPKGDRDQLLRGRSLGKPSPEDLRKLPLRMLFVEGRDLEIAHIIHNYFSAVRRRWPEAWDSRERGAILNRTNGVRALLRFLKIAYARTATSPSDVPNVEKFCSLFRDIKIEDRDFTTENFLPGSSGEGRIYRILCKEEEFS